MVYVAKCTLHLSGWMTSSYFIGLVLAKEIITSQAPPILALKLEYADKEALAFR